MCCWCDAPNDHRRLSPIIFVFSLEAFDSSALTHSVGLSAYRASDCLCVFLKERKNAEEDSASMVFSLVVELEVEIVDVIVESL